MCLGCCLLLPAGANCVRHLLKLRSCPLQLGQPLHHETFCWGIGDIVPWKLVVDSMSMDNSSRNWVYDGEGLTVEVVATPCIAWRSNKLHKFIIAKFFSSKSLAVQPHELSKRQPLSQTNSQTVSCSVAWVLKLSAIHMIQLDELSNLWLSSRMSSKPLAIQVDELSNLRLFNRMRS